MTTDRIRAGVAGERDAPDAGDDGRLDCGERALSAAAGAAMGIWGLRRGGLLGLVGMAAGASLLARGASGHCAAKAALCGSPAERRIARERGWRSAVEVTQTATIARPPREVYDFWRNVENLARFMRHVERIDALGDDRSRWVYRTPAAGRLEWTSRITEDAPGERIAWETEDHADVRSAGRVEFRNIPDTPGSTRVVLHMAYEPPGGAIGRALARLWRERPGAARSHDDLLRLKELLEGEAGGAPQSSEPETG